jgi:SAM-dependent methyltransferase
MGWLEGAGSVLDLGCAEGLFVHLASNRGWKVVAVDVDTDSVSAARSRTPEADFALGSGESLPFRSGTFDGVIMLDVLEHVPSEDLALREVDRVLKQGGKLVISVPHKGVFGFIDAQNSLIFATGRKIIKGKENGQHHKHYSLEELQGMLGSSFRLTRCRYGGYLLFPVLGYVLMFTDALHLRRLSASLRRVEQVDFDRDRGNRSWHLMAEFIKQ